MLHSKVGDWVIPLENLLPIDSEQRGQSKKPLQITTTEALQIESIPVKEEGEEQLKFRGIRGQFLACFFKPMNETIVAQQGADHKRQNILSILAAHNAQNISTTIEVEIVFEGRTYTLLGTRESVVDLCMRTVEMLASESAPQNQIVANTAPEAFECAVEMLIKKGSKFYTVLRSSWALPALCWEICP